MTDRQHPPAAAAIPEVDGQFLTFAGFVVGLAWVFGLVSYWRGTGWQPQGLLVRQWLAVGIAVVPYTAAYATSGRLLIYVRSVAGRFKPLDRALRGFASFSAVFERAGMRPFATALALALAVSAALAPESIIRGMLWVALLLVVIPQLLLPRAFRRLQNLLDGIAPLVVRDRAFVVRAALRALFIAAFLICAWRLIVDDHRRIALLLGVLQTAAFLRLAPRECTGFVRVATILIASIGSWALALGFAYTPLDQWLLSATGSSALGAVAFAGAFSLVLLEFAAVRNVRIGAASVPRLVPIAAAIAAFAELGLRTDNLLTDWLPYHRTYYTAPADFIRQGAWPLWDYPSLYGVLSEISLAFWPSKSTWQALYLETAVTLGVVALLLFFLLRYRRAGATNVLFALTVTCAVVYSSQCGRYPMGWRLYPQLGLRFQWLIAVLGIAFFLHCNRNDPVRRRLGYVAGYLVWAISIAWSFECGIFTSIAWCTFVVGDVVIKSVGPRAGVLGRVFTGILPLLAIPLALFIATEVLFRTARGHGPDWLAFVEFSSAFRQDYSGLLTTLDLRGAVWTIALVLIGIGSVGVALVRQRRYACLPVVAACWFGLWGASIYFVGETIEVHANGLAPVFATGIAIVLALQRFEGGPPFVSVATRAAFAPLFVLVLAYAFGEPHHIGEIRAPFMPGFSLDSTASTPAISGELGTLFARAGVRPRDDVILPIAYLANKLEIGEILPFVRDSQGMLVEQTAWLPMSPIGPFNALQTLSFDRRRLYIRRYLADVGRTGWYVTYHSPARCNALHPGLATMRVERSQNYEIAWCAVGPQAFEAQNKRGTR